MSKIRSIEEKKRQIDPDLIELLDNLKQAVMSGHVTGLLVLTTNPVGDYTYSSVGTMRLSEACNAFNGWEFDQRLKAWRLLNP